jgi:hypothetical protein
MDHLVQIILLLAVSVTVMVAFQRLHIPPSQYFRSGGPAYRATATSGTDRRLRPGRSYHRGIAEIEQRRLYGRRYGSDTVTARTDR